MGERRGDGGGLTASRPSLAGRLPRGMAATASSASPDGLPGYAAMLSSAFGG
jgi:hypothetical protein